MGLKFFWPVYLGLTMSSTCAWSDHIGNICGQAWTCVMYKKIFVINIMICNILMFYQFKIVVFLSLRERICSPKEFAPFRIFILLLKEFAPLRIFWKFVFT